MCIRDRETTRCGNSSVPMPSGFEGWVRIPWSIMTGNGGVVPGDVVCNLVIYITSFGGEMGGFTLSSLMQATNDVMSKDGVVMNGSGKIQNLFTGAEMTKAELEGTSSEPTVSTPSGEPGTSSTPDAGTSSGGSGGNNGNGGSNPSTGEPVGALAVLTLAGLSGAVICVSRKKRR